MGLEECLEEIVGVLADHFFADVVFIPVGKADSRRLVEPQHIRRFSPAVGVDRGGRSVVVDAARTVFGQQRQGAGASRTTSQPHYKGGVFVDHIFFLFVFVRTFFEHPEEKVFVPIFVVLGSLDIHVPADGFTRSVAKVGRIRTGLVDGFSQLQRLRAEFVEKRPALRIVRCRRRFSGAVRRSAVEDARGEAPGLIGGHAHGRNGGALAPNARLAGIGIARAGTGGFGSLGVAVGFADRSKLVEGMVLAVAGRGAKAIPGRNHR
mmetsp:Transcript_9583/g.23522  ORF Transcript_9583/g.23522 Transcript_9583/m.23522 type:complete len:264 (-) Transcript_9583:191-982(-)